MDAYDITIQSVNIILQEERSSPEESIKGRAQKKRVDKKDRKKLLYPLRGFEKWS
jgi:hypothetical protein